jgi:hypothetical protein
MTIVIKEEAMGMEGRNIVKSECIFCSFGIVFSGSPFIVLQVVYCQSQLEYLSH